MHAESIEESAVLAVGVGNSYVTRADQRAGSDGNVRRELGRGIVGAAVDGDATAKATGRSTLEFAPSDDYTP